MQSFHFLVRQQYGFTSTYDKLGIAIGQFSRLKLLNKVGGILILVIDKRQGFTLTVILGDIEVGGIDQLTGLLRALEGEVTTIVFDNAGGLVEQFENCVDLPVPQVPMTEAAA